MINNSHELVASINSGKKRVYSFGVGYIYYACRALHGYSISAFIHTKPEMFNWLVDGVRVITPEEACAEDIADIVVIIYTASYKKEAQEFCLNNGFSFIFFDDPAHLPPSRITEITNALRFASQSNLIRELDLKRLTNALKPSADQNFVEDLINNLPGHWGQYIDDLCKALTKAVYWHQLSGGIGDIAEFGTASGVTSSFIAAAMAQQQAEPYMVPIRPTNLHLFDSFRGLPEINNPLDVEAGWQCGMFSGLSESELIDRIARFLPRHQIRTYPGWFKDTLKTIPSDTKFAMIHIDCDLYESTIDVLDYLFSKKHLLDGCSIFFDDWNCGNASPRLGERRAWGEIIEKYKVRYSDCGEYSCAGHKFIIHLD
jgi:hypothetical protein